MARSLFPAQLWDANPWAEQVRLNRSVVRVGPFRRPQLRHGARWLGGALGTLLERPSLLMSYRSSDPDDEPDTEIQAEGTIEVAFESSLSSTTDTDPGSEVHGSHTDRPIPPEAAGRLPGLN